MTPSLFLYGGPTYPPLLNPHPYPQFPILIRQRSPFTPPPWITTDDRLRGGSSRSSLTALPHNAARFAGHLDTTTLGGAGFASQFSPGSNEKREELSSDSQTGDPWDLLPYAGLEITLGDGGDGKKYTLVLKDATPPPGGSEGVDENQASVSFEADFVAGNGVGSVWLPWGEFKATYRGKPVEGGQLKREDVRRVGLMMRRYARCFSFPFVRD